MKKIFSIMIALVLTLSCLPLSLFAVSAEETNTVKRYSVLLLDVSDTASFIGEHGETIYTAPSAIEYVKQSANSFLMDLINAKGENYVAVVSFNETASSSLPFITPSAPSSIALSSLFCIISTTYTLLTPSAFSAIILTRPMHPAPITTAVCPAWALP